MIRLGLINEFRQLDDYSEAIKNARTAFLVVKDELSQKHHLYGTLLFLNESEFDQFAFEHAIRFGCVDPNIMKNVYEKIVYQLIKNGQLSSPFANAVEVPDFIPQKKSTTEWLTHLFSNEVANAYDCLKKLSPDDYRTWPLSGLYTFFATRQCAMLIKLYRSTVFPDGNIFKILELEAVFENYVDEAELKLILRLTENSAVKDEKKAVEIKLRNKILLDEILNAEVAIILNLISVEQNVGALNEAGVRLLAYATENDSQKLAILLPALKSDIRSILYLNLGLTFCIGEGNLRHALHCFLRSLQLNKNNPPALSLIGLLCLKKLNIENATQAFNTAHILEPLQVEHWCGRAMLSQLQNDSNTYFLLFWAAESASSPSTSNHGLERLYKIYHGELSDAVVATGFKPVILIKFLLGSLANDSWEIFWKFYREKLYPLLVAFVHALEMDSNWSNGIISTLRTNRPLHKFLEVFPVEISEHHFDPKSRRKEDDTFVLYDPSVEPLYEVLSFIKAEYDSETSEIQKEKEFLPIYQPSGQYEFENGEYEPQSEV
uniref:Uncharacterized protein n=1 Tax=Panagrolaimus davidi TaxID=227884 RepID=A0A914PGK3_9BILA